MQVMFIRKQVSADPGGEIVNQFLPPKKGILRNLWHRGTGVRLSLQPTVSECVFSPPTINLLKVKWVCMLSLVCT